MNAAKTMSYIVPAAVALLALSAAAAPPADRTVLDTHAGGIELLPANPGSAHELRIQAPDGTLTIHDFRPGEVPSWPVDTGVSLPGDGQYKFELRRVPPVGLTRAPADLPTAGIADRLSKDTTVASGAFTVADGQVIPHDLEEGSRGKRLVTAKDQVINDDLLVLGSECVGFDCVNGEVFGFDTLRLKENNTRLQFNDTSTASSFPTNNWQIRANSSANGGSSFLAFLDQGASGDSESGRIVFGVDAGARTNALYVDSGGDVGIGTSTPVVDLHVVTGNTPTHRLEQNTSAGFSAQTWDVAGNEANFFVRDATGGSRLPFRIRPGAPTSSIDIGANGSVGVGTASPDSALHVERSSDARIRVENTTTSAGQRVTLELINNGKNRFLFNNTQAGEIWSLDNSGGSFDISRVGTGVAEFSLMNNGDGHFEGDVFANGVMLTSSREFKTDFSPVDEGTVLEKIAMLEVSQWRYKREQNTERHIGPMAEDFQKIFGLGDGRHISAGDANGILFAATKALRQRTTALKAENNAIKIENEALRAELNEVKSAITELRARLH